MLIPECSGCWMEKSGGAERMALLTSRAPIAIRPRACVASPLLLILGPLADALALSWSRSTTRGNSGAFEYGWVRGIGSAAFIAGVLVAGQSAAVWGRDYVRISPRPNAEAVLRLPLPLSQHWLASAGMDR